MKTEAVKEGYFETPYGKYQKIQILTIRELFEGKQPNIPLVDPSAFKRAAKEGEGGDQEKLRFEPSNALFGGSWDARILSFASAALTVRTRAVRLGSTRRACAGCGSLDGRSV